MNVLQRKKKGLRLSFQAFKGHFTIWEAQNLLIGRPVGR